LTTRERDPPQNAKVGARGTGGKMEDLADQGEQL